MRSKISETGYWSGDYAHQHHVHSPQLANYIADLLISTKKPVYDFGCGLGEYLSKLKEVGLTDLAGFEGDIPVAKKFDNIVQVDLTKPFSVSTKGHVIMLEVGEHIPAKYEQQLLENVKNACEGFLILSWAVPGQAGFGHVNCLDNETVIKKFERLGFEYLEASTTEARKCTDNFTPWFKNTILIFYKN